MSEKSPDVDDVIDSLGWGKFHWCFVATVGGFHVTTGAFMQLFGIVGDSVVDEAGVDDAYRGYLASVTFVGLSLGCLCSSLGDVLGRRMTWLFGAGIMCSSWAVTGQAEALWVHFLLRALAGFGMGITIPTGASLVSELVPSTERVFMNVVGGNVPFSLGMMYAVVLCHAQDPSMRNIDWRPLVWSTALPGILCWIGSAIFVVESPRYNALHGRRADGHASLVYIAKMNGIDEPADNWVCDEPMEESLLTVLCGRLWSTTLCLCFSTITLNYVYYGSLYSTPIILQDHATHSAATVHLFLASVVELLGFVVGNTFAHRYTRRALVLFYLVACALLTGVLMVCMLHLPAYDEPFQDRHKVIAHCFSAAIYLFRGMTSVGWLYVYLYIAEIYPTVCRAGGVSVALAVGRIGSITAPLIIGHNVVVFFSVSIALYAINSACVYWFLPIETKDRQLGSIAREQQLLIPHGSSTSSISDPKSKRT